MAAGTIVPAELLDAGKEGAHAARTAKVAPRFYRPELDVFRFFAFLIVFLHHGVYTFSPLLSRFGGFGLSLFFLLSAFLITELLQREKAAKNTISLRSFYIRRSLRIWPLYFGFLLFTVILGAVFPGHRAPLGFVLSFVFMVGNIYVGRWGFPNSPAGFLWSISVEEQFYLFWPLLNLFCSRRMLGWIAVCAFPVGTVAGLIILAHNPGSNLPIWTSALFQFQVFACGVLLSLVLKGATPRYSAATRAGMFVFGILAIGASAQWSAVDTAFFHGPVNPVTGYSLVCLGSVAVFLSSYGMPPEWIPRPLVYLGKISYGLYVFHEFALEVAGRILNGIPVSNSTNHHLVYGIGHLALGFLLSVGAAMLSYRFFETPFLKLKDSLAVVRSRET